MLVQKNKTNYCKLIQNVEKIYNKALKYDVYNGYRYSFKY